MFFLELNTVAVHDHAAAQPSACLEFLRSVEQKKLSYKEACKATKTYRDFNHLQTSLPALYVSLPSTIEVSIGVDTIAVAGYWLYHAIYGDVIGYVAVPTDSNLTVIVPTNEVAYILFAEPCPPPTPCPPNGPLSNNLLFNQWLSINP